MGRSLLDLEGIIDAGAEILLLVIVEAIDVVVELIDACVRAEESISEVLKLTVEVLEHLILFALAEFVELVLDLLPVVSEQVEHLVCCLGSSGTSLVWVLQPDRELLDCHISFF